MNLIKEYLIDKYRIITNLLDDTNIENEILSEIKKKKNIKKHKISGSFFIPERMKRFRLPSIFGEYTSLFHQISTYDVTTSSNGSFCIQWLPQFFVTQGSTSQTGLYYANNILYDGTNNLSAASLNNTNFNAFTNPVFSGIRLVSASVTIKYTAYGNNISGQIIGGIQLELPTFSLPSGTNYTFKNIESM